jgi:hypothetical protein
MPEEKDDPRIRPAEGDLPPAGNEREEDLSGVIARLESERPVPRAAFRGELRRSLLATPDRSLVPRRRALAVVTAYAGSGLFLLAVAAIGLAGIGPFAA